MTMILFSAVELRQQFMYSGIWYIKIEEKYDSYGRYNARSEHGDKHYFSESEIVYIL